MPTRAGLRASPTLLLVLLLPACGANFTDPLPDLSASVTAAATGAGTHVAGHANGQVVAVDAASLGNLWSRNVGGPVRDLAVLGDVAVVAQGPNVVALRLADGNVAWQHTAGALIAAVDASAGSPWAVTASGEVLRFDATGAVAEQLASGLPAAADLDVREGRWITVGHDGLVVAADGGVATQRVLGSYVRVRWTGPDMALAVDEQGRLHRVLLVGVPSVEPAALQAVVSALDGADGDAVAGDADGLLHALDASGMPRFPGLATYANAVLDVALRDGTAVAAFRGGWLGALRLEPAAVGLILSPTEGDYVGNPVLVRWAYADPDAEDGEQVRHRIAIRPAGGNWQVVASGFSRVDPLTRLREQVVDLGALASGTPFDLRLELVDADGRLRITGLGRSLILDAEPPEPVGRPVPGDGERVATGLPEVGFGHRDLHSGVFGRRTAILLDGEADRVDWRTLPAYTTFTPTRDGSGAGLADGMHAWQATVEDRAGNRLLQAGRFLVDTTLPVPGDVAVEAFADALLLRFPTPEPAACDATAGGQRAEDGVSRTHALALVGLAPDTAYAVRVQCRDEGGSSASRDVAARTRPGQGDGGILLGLTLAPAAPDGAAGFYVTAPRVQVDVQPAAATVQWSIDGGPLADLPANATVPDGTHNVLVVARSPDGAAAARSLRVRVDATPPARPSLAFEAARSTVTWPALSDPDSGVAAATLEGRLDGGWVTLAELPPHAREASGVPPDLSEVRLVVRNGAGAQAVSDPLVLPVHEGDRLHSSAALVAPAVAAGDRVRVRVRLAEPDQAAEVVLIDANGVHRSFSDGIGVGPRTIEYSAPASAFRAGLYDVEARLAPSGAVLDVGPLQVGAAPASRETGERGLGVAERDAPLPLLVALGLPLAAWAQRRRL